MYFRVKSSTDDSGSKNFTCLSLSISYDLLAPKRFNFMVLNEKQVPAVAAVEANSSGGTLVVVKLFEALGIRCSFLLISIDM